MAKVLIIDKEEHFGILCKERLEDVGVDPIYITDFDRALFVLSIDKYDAIILDPSLWEKEYRLSADKGIELFKKIREKNKQIPIIVDTSILDIENIFLSNGVEADSYIDKGKCLDEAEFLLELSKFINIDADLVKKYTDPPSKKVRIFICHAKEDFSHAYTIYEILKQKKYRPWIDRENILPGQDWDLEIEKAMLGCSFFLACLSKNSVTKEGYVQKELKRGLEILDKKPQGAIYIIPVRLDEYKVPPRFEKLQWCDFFEVGAVEKLLEAIRIGCKERGIMNTDDYDLA